MLDIQPGIKFGEIGIAAITKYTLDKIQVADKIPRREEPDLHGLLGFNARDLRTNNRTQQQRYKHPRRFRQPGGKRYRQQFLRWRERTCQHEGKCLFGYRLLVAGYRQPPFADMERTLRGAPVTGRIVQHTLRYAVTGDDVRVEFILAHGQGQLACHAVAIQYKGLCRQHRHTVEFKVGKVAFQEVLDAQVDRALVVGQQPVFLPVAFQQVT